jgi:phage tail-like protein
MGRQIRGRRQQGERAGPHDRGGRASRRRRSLVCAQVSQPHRLRGVTHDTAFEDWANKVWRLGAALGAEVGLADFRKDITIEVYNEAGQLTLAYQVHRCWVSQYQALPELDANSNAVMIQHIRLENEGWERDTTVPEPKEPN